MNASVQLPRPHLLNSCSQCASSVLGATISATLKVWGHLGSGLLVELACKHMSSACT